MDKRWKPHVTVATVVEHEGRFLLVEEHTTDGLRLNNPAGHLDPGESPAQGAARETLEAETVRTVALDKALKQARLRFDAGIASHLDVLDVERNLLIAELVRIDSERARKAALADMFKALGGGWPASAKQEAGTAG